VGIRALRDPSPQNSPYFAEPNRHYDLNNGKNNLHTAGCLTLKNKINSFFRTMNRKTSSTQVGTTNAPTNARTFLERKTVPPQETPIDV
jgi:hypothetical protein